MRWRLQRVSLSPEAAGLCGCWQFIALWRERKELRQGKVTEESEEYSFYCTSAAPKQYSAPQLLQSIRDHWSSSENGSHYRRDVSLGEDASRIGGRGGAYVMATLRNLLLGLMELQRDRGHTQARTFPGWRRKLTTTQKIQLMIQTLGIVDSLTPAALPQPGRSQATVPAGRAAHQRSIRRRETNPSGAPTPSKGPEQSAHALQDGCRERR